MFELPPPDEPAPPVGRTRHPYFMHEMIRRQAVAARATCRAVSEALTATPEPPPSGRLLLVGIGTSFHAALAAEYESRARFAGRWETTARESFDVLEDPSVATKEALAIVFSASGETALTLHAQKVLRDRGTRSVLISTRAASPSSELADRTLVTQYAEEASWTHTVSYTAALVAVGALFDRWAGDPAADEAHEDEVGEAVTHALATENPVVEIADTLSVAPQFLLLGSGAARAPAREGALKLREAAGRFCATVGVEEFLHGVLPSVSARTAVVALADTPFERARALEGLAAARELDAKTLLLDGSGGPEGEGILLVPPAERPSAAVRLAIPLQLLAYWMAVSEGRNPDIMGLDETRQLNARKRFGI